MPATFQGKENFRQGDAWIDGAGSESVPTVTSLTPSSGGYSGGRTVTVVGTNLAAVTSVTVGGQRADFTLVSGTGITFVLPEQSAAGVKSVVISNAEGASTGSNVTYEDLPTITSKTVSTGTAAGGTSTVITGTGFLSVAATGAVKFGTTVATYTVNSATQITATSPAHAAGAVNITVTNDEGVSVSTATFTYT
jgi:hypothetical protein